MSMVIDPVSTGRPLALLRATAVLVAALLAAGPVVVASSASAAAKSSLSVTFASTSLEIGTRAVAEVCATNVPATWVTSLEEVEGTVNLWTSIVDVTISGTKCTGVSLPQDEPGRFTFRTRSLDGTEITYESAVATITVYRHVPYQVVCIAQSDCRFAHGSGSEEINSHITNYLDRVTDVGITDGEFTYSLKSNSCRAMTLDTVFLHTSQTGSGAPGDSIAIQVVQRTINPQSVEVSYNVPIASTFDLDGGPVEIDVIGITAGEQFVLVSGALDCYTLDGRPDLP